MAACTSENTTRIIITVDKELKSKAEECAKKERRSLSNLVVVALEEYINKNRKDS